jgi:hypothetical protein
VSEISPSGFSCGTNESFSTFGQEFRSKPIEFLTSPKTYARLPNTSILHRNACAQLIRDGKCLSVSAILRLGTLLNDREHA